MKIQIYSISHEGKRGDKEIYNPNSKDIYHAQILVGLCLLKQGYRCGIGTLQVQSQGFGRGSPIVHMPYSAQHALIDSYVDFNPDNDSSVLKVSFALESKKLESIVQEIMRGSGLPLDKWNSEDFGLIEVSNSFPKNPERICVKAIMEAIKSKYRREDITAH